MTDRRRHPREMTIESLDRDIRLMREMHAIRLDFEGLEGSEVIAFLNQQEIDRLRKRILELVKMREDINAKRNTINIG